jgi:hypothetical protein
MMWIEHRDIEGGPVAYFTINIAAWYNTLGTAADVAANILGDGLMVGSFLYWSHVTDKWSALPLLCFLEHLLYLGCCVPGAPLLSLLKYAYLRFILPLFTMIFKRWELLQPCKVPYLVMISSMDRPPTLLPRG